MNRLIVAVCAAGALATAAFAHQGVQNAAVKARMDGMSEIGSATKTLGNMARGNTAFDAAAAQNAATILANEAAQIPMLFERPETDPKSEALPSIWASFDDFTEKARALNAAARLAAEAGSQAELQSAMQQIGAACSACHRAYRE